MSTIYIPHTVTTIAEINALALTDRQPNGAIVMAAGEAFRWDLPYAVRNERAGRWENYGTDEVLHDGDEVTVLVPIEAEEEWRVRDPSGAKYPVSAQTTALGWVADTNEGQPQSRLVTPWRAR